MSEYIKKWISIIENMNNDNTYKLAWGRALIELITELDNIQEENVFTFYDIAKKMLKYYWNQEYFFKLKQSPRKIPVIVQETQKCIERYQELSNSTLPIWFDKAEVVLMKDMNFYEKEVGIIARKLGDDVSWRFKNVNGSICEIYTLNKKDKCVYFTKNAILELKEYSVVIAQLLNYRWAQLLEKFNSSPRIALKVKGISDEKLRRNSLKKFRELLIEYMENDKVVDFYTGKVLDENDISVDHVIPWSFMYSDDIWNLVLTSRSENSKKNNNIPSEEIISKLEKRNEELLGKISDSKYYSDLKIAIDNNYVRKFYLSCKL